jgi:lipopolysaccharide transport system ATP-binding protein
MVGVIGRNGAGKSTLLKVLSRITPPTSGEILYRGTMASLLEVGTGFHPELTGRENVYLNGVIMGLSRRQIARKFDAIVVFAEIEQFIDTPVKRYSSGMYVRLAFAVAAHLDRDILLIDEVLAVGDLAFQRKCLNYASQLKDRNATILLVSHNMFAVKSMCDRAICLSRGEVVYDGEPEDAIRRYEQDSGLEPLPWARGRLGIDPARFPVRVTRAELLDEDGRPRTVFDHGERARLRLHFQVNQPVERPNFVVCFMRSDNTPCCNFSSALDGIRIPCFTGEGVVELTTPPLRLVAEMYELHVLVWDEAFQTLYCAQKADLLHVRHDILDTHFGVFHESGEWSVSV